MQIHKINPRVGTCLINQHDIINGIPKLCVTTPVQTLKIVEKVVIKILPQYFHHAMLHPKQIWFNNVYSHMYWKIA